MKLPNITSPLVKGACLFEDPFTKKPIIEVHLNPLFEQEDVINVNWGKVVAALEEAKELVGWPEKLVFPKYLITELDLYFRTEGLYLILSAKTKQRLSLLIMPSTTNRLMDIKHDDLGSLMFPKPNWMITCSFMPNVDIPYSGED